MKRGNHIQISHKTPGFELKVTSSISKNHMTGLKQKGFTIVESLVSILILTIVMVGGIQIFFGASKFVTKSSFKKLAINIANSRLEEIRRDGYGSLPNPAPGPNGVNIETNQQIKEDDEFFFRTVNVIDVVGENYKSVTVTVDWTEAGDPGSQRVQFTTYVTQ